MSSILWRRPGGFLVGAVLGFSGLAGLAWAAKVDVGNPAPNVAGTWLNHDTTTLQDLRGYAVLLEFWGTH